MVGTAHRPAHLRQIFRSVHHEQRKFVVTAELNDRIRILEDNIRQLIEQAAAASGEQNKSRIADRLSQQNEELERLTRERDARSKK